MLGVWLSQKPPRSRLISIILLLLLFVRGWLAESTIQIRRRDHPPLARLADLIYGFLTNPVV